MNCKTIGVQAETYYCFRLPQGARRNPSRLYCSRVNSAAATVAA